MDTYKKRRGRLMVDWEAIARQNSKARPCSIFGKQLLDRIQKLDLAQFVVW